MILIYSKEMKNKRWGVSLLWCALSVFLAFIFFLVLIVGFMVDSSNIWDVVFLPIPLILPLCLVYYNLDEGIWQLTGKEICECDDKGIVITKHRLFKRQKYIPWSEITKIYLYSPNIYLELLRLIYFHQNFYEIKSQSTIVLRYGNGKKYKCGTNLSKTQAQKAIKLLKSNNPTNCIEALITTS